MSKSKIQWTQHTLNLVAGCTKVSEGCRNCYAQTMHTRLTRMHTKGYEQPFSQIVLHHHRLTEPMGRKKPTIYFINSMSDLFHEEVTDSFITNILTMIAHCPRHRFILLTKRSTRMSQFMTTHPLSELSENIITGVTVENRSVLNRINDLRNVPTTRFLSIEPLLEDLGDINLTGIHWVIVGGESGHNARPIQKEWVESLYNQCIENNIPFFFKQWGGRNKQKAGNQLNGQTIQQQPSILM